MKRVLFITDRVMHYQKETYKALHDQLLKHGVELWLLSGEDASRTVGRVGITSAVVPNEAKFGFREFHVGSYTLRRYVDVMEKIKAIAPTVVIDAAHVGNFTHWRIAAAKRRSGYRLVSWLCGYEFHPGRLKKALLDRFVPQYDFHLAYHTNARAYALMHGAKGHQIAIMHNTINEAKVARIPKADAVRLLNAKHPEIQNRRIVLFVGAILAEKRVEVILHAMTQLARSDVVFVLVGDGEHLPAIRAACAGRSDVVITGAVIDGVGPYFDAAEVYLLPGTGGLGINEAMAHGLPVISGFADGSADDLVIDGVNGFRLREGTAEELADRLAAILADPNLSAQMGSKSRELITTKFAFEGFIERITTALVALA